MTMQRDNNIQAFFALVKAGLWEQEVRLSQFEKTDFQEVYRIAEEQSVVGLVAAGLEHVVDVTVPKIDVLTFVGSTLQMEQRNKEMNSFLGSIVEKMRKAGIYTILLKGQGVAQCYERPLWRASGDVDFLLHNDDYEKAKVFLSPMASFVASENSYSQHLGITIDTWTVELHGSVHCGLSNRIDKGLDAIRDDVFYGGDVRSWICDRTQVFMPGVNNDSIFLFTHILQHFYKGGIGIRQICDWSRLLWSYRDSIDIGMLERRLRELGLMNEWKAFGTFAVEYLGMPCEAMPFYSGSNRWKRKARLRQSVSLMSGNFGHNRDRSYYEKYPYVIRKFCSFGRRVGDMFSHAQIFPLDSLRFFVGIVFNGLRSAIKGE